MKHCKYCNQDKPFEPSAKAHSKASGFVGARCWECFSLAAKVNAARCKANGPTKLPHLDYILFIREKTSYQ